MKRTLAGLVIGIAMVCGVAGGEEILETHRSFLPQDIKWSPGPAALPAGGESATLYGDPQKEGMFALRIKVPNGYRIAPHTHPRPEFVTVISGKPSFGFGQSVDRATAQALPAGSFASMAPGVAHYVLPDEDSVYQINAVGPWGMDYVNPNDDPRLNGGRIQNQSFILLEGDRPARCNPRVEKHATASTVEALHGNKSDAGDWPRRSGRQPARSG